MYSILACSVGNGKYDSTLAAKNTLELEPVPIPRIKRLPANCLKQLLRMVGDLMHHCSRLVGNDFRILSLNQFW